MPINASCREVYGFRAPAVLAAVITLQMENHSIIEVKYTNLLSADAKSMPIKLKDSEDGVTYTDVASSNKTVVPGGVAAFTGNVRQYFQVWASGQTQGEVEISVEKTTQLWKMDN